MASTPVDFQTSPHRYFILCDHEGQPVLDNIDQQNLPSTKEISRALMSLSHNKTCLLKEDSRNQALTINRRQKIFPVYGPTQDPKAQEPAQFNFIAFDSPPENAALYWRFSESTGTFGPGLIVSEINLCRRNIEYRIPLHQERVLRLVTIKPQKIKRTELCKISELESYLSKEEATQWLSQFPSLNQERLVWVSPDKNARLATKIFLASPLSAEEQPQHIQNLADDEQLVWMLPREAGLNRKIFIDPTNGNCLFLTHDNILHHEFLPRKLLQPINQDTEISIVSVAEIDHTQQSRNVIYLVENSGEFLIYSIEGERNAGFCYKTEAERTTDLFQRKTILDNKKQILAYFSSHHLIPPKGTPTVDSDNVTFKTLLATCVENSKNSGGAVQTERIYPLSTWTARKKGDAIGVTPKEMHVNINNDPTNPTYGDLLLSNNLPAEQKQGIEDLTAFIEINYIANTRKILGITVHNPITKASVLLSRKEFSQLYAHYNPQEFLAEFMEDFFLKQNSFYVTDFTPTQKPQGLKYFIINGSVLDGGAGEDSPEQATFMTTDVIEIFELNEIYRFDIHVKAEKIPAQQANKFNYKVLDVIVCCRNNKKVQGLDLTKIFSAEKVGSLQEQIFGCMLGLVSTHEILAAPIDLSVSKGKEELGAGSISERIQAEDDDKTLVIKFYVMLKILPRIVSTFTSLYLPDKAQCASLQEYQAKLDAFRQLNAEFGEIAQKFQSPLFGKQRTVSLNTLKAINEILHFIEHLDEKAHKLNLSSKTPVSEDMSQHFISCVIDNISEPLRMQQKTKAHNLINSLDFMSKGALKNTLDNFVCFIEGISQTGDFAELKQEPYIEFNEQNVVNPQLLNVFHQFCSNLDLDPTINGYLSMVKGKLEDEYHKNIYALTKLSFDHDETLKKSLQTMTHLISAITTMHNQNAAQYLANFTQATLVPYGEGHVINLALITNLEEFKRIMHEDKNTTAVVNMILEQLYAERKRNIACAQQQGLHGAGEVWREKIIAAIKALKATHIPDLIATSRKEASFGSKRDHAVDTRMKADAEKAKQERLRMEQQSSQSLSRRMSRKTSDIPYEKLSYDEQVEKLITWFNTHENLSDILHGHQQKLQYLHHMLKLILDKMIEFCAPKDGTFKSDRTDIMPDDKFAHKISEICSNITKMLSPIPRLESRPATDRMQESGLIESQLSSRSSSSSSRTIDSSSPPTIQNIPSQEEELKHQEEQKRKEEALKYEEDLKRQEEQKRKEEELKHQEELKIQEQKRKEEDLKRQEEHKRKEEALKYEEELKRQEEQKREEEELKRQEDLKRQEEQKRKEEELKRQKEQKHKEEEHEPLEEQKRKEEALKREEEREPQEEQKCKKEGLKSEKEQQQKQEEEELSPLKKKKIELIPQDQLDKQLTPTPALVPASPPTSPMLASTLQQTFIPAPPPPPPSSLSKEPAASRGGLLDSIVQAGGAGFFKNKPKNRSPETKADTPKADSTLMGLANQAMLARRKSMIDIKSPTDDYPQYALCDDLKEIPTFLPNQLYVNQQNRVAILLGNVEKYNGKPCEHNGQPCQLNLPDSIKFEDGLGLKGAILDIAEQQGFITRKENDSDFYTVINIEEIPAPKLNVVYIDRNKRIAILLGETGRHKGQPRQFELPEEKIDFNQSSLKLKQAVLNEAVDRGFIDWGNDDTAENKPEKKKTVTFSLGGPEVPTIPPSRSKTPPPSPRF